MPENEKIQKWCYCNESRHDHMGPFATRQQALEVAVAYYATEVDRALQRCRDVYLVEDEARVKRDAADPNAVMQQITFLGIPPGATFYFDGATLTSARAIVQKMTTVSLHRLVVAIPGYIVEDKTFVAIAKQEVTVQLRRPKIEVARCVAVSPADFATVIQASDIRDDMEVQLVNERSVVGSGRAFELLPGAEKALEEAAATWSQTWIRSDAWVVLEETREELEL